MAVFSSREVKNHEPKAASIFSPYPSRSSFLKPLTALISKEMGDYQVHNLIIFLVFYKLQNASPLCSFLKFLSSYWHTDLYFLPYKLTEMKESIYSH